MATPHFDAQLIPGPHVSHGSPVLSLIQGAHQVGHNLHEVIEDLGLDSPDLCLTWISVLPEKIQCPTDLDRTISCKLGPWWHLK